MNDYISFSSNAANAIQNQHYDKLFVCVKRRKDGKEYRFETTHFPLISKLFHLLTSKITSSKYYYGEKSIKKLSNDKPIVKRFLTFQG